MTLSMHKNAVSAKQIDHYQEEKKVQYFQMSRVLAVAVALTSCRIHLKEKLRCYSFEEE